MEGARKPGGGLTAAARPAGFPAHPPCRADSQVVDLILGINADDNLARDDTSSKRDYREGLMVDVEILLLLADVVRGGLKYHGELLPSTLYIILRFVFQNPRYCWIVTILRALRQWS